MIIGEVISVCGASYKITSAKSTKQGVWTVTLIPYSELSGDEIANSMQELIETLLTEKMNVNQQSKLIINWVSKVGISYGLSATQFMRLNTSVVHRGFRNIVSAGNDINQIIHALWFMLNDKFWIKHIIGYLLTWSNDDCKKFEQIKYAMSNTVHDMEIIKDSSTTQFEVVDI